MATETAAMSEARKRKKLELIHDIVHEADERWHRGEYVSLRVILSRIKRILESEEET